LLNFKRSVLTKSLLSPILLTASTLAFAAEWDVGVGPGYASGISDVANLYEENLEEDEYDEVDVLLIPVGVAFKAYYQAENGIRIGMGAGPFFIVAGDSDHTEIPLSGYVGFRFLQSAKVSPYINIGYVSHIVSGEYVEDSTPGMLAAIGLEFSPQSRVSFALELAVDKSTVEFEQIGGEYVYDSTFQNGYYQDYSNIELNTYDTTLSFYVLF